MDESRKLYRRLSVTLWTSASATISTLCQSITDKY